MKILFAINNQEYIFSCSPDRLVDIRKKIAGKMSDLLKSGVRPDQLPSWSMANLDAPRKFLNEVGVVRDPRDININDTIENFLSRNL